MLETKDDCFYDLRHGDCVDVMALLPPNTVLSEDIIEKLDNIGKDEKKSSSMLLRKAAEKLIEDYQKRVEEACEAIRNLTT